MTGKNSKLKPQKPAKGILNICDYDDLEVYHIDCSCHDSEHIVELCVAYDEEVNDITIYFGQQFIRKSFTEKIKDCFKVIFKGYHTQYNEIILEPQTAVNLSDCLNKSIKKVEAKITTQK